MSENVSAFMKFGKQIRAASRPEWKPNYLNYKLLKTLVNNCKLDRLQSTEEFAAQLEAEVRLF